MKDVPIHVGIWLACVLFVFLSLISLAMAEGTQNSKAFEPLDKVKEFHENFINHVDTSELSFVQPRLYNNEISFPKASVPVAGLDKFYSNYRSNFPSLKENVAINSSYSEEHVKDLISLSANKQRDIVFDDIQCGESMKQGMKNSLDVTVSGKGQIGVNAWLDGDSDDVAIESLVDNAMTASENNDSVYYRSRSGSPAQQRLGNDLNIDVSGINVKAINTVEGGSAVATSNIIIKPVQIINCPAEVQEKLK
jgi:hypothetical protein